LISLHTRISYGLGGAMFSIKEGAYSVFVLLFYTQVLGLGGTAAGLALTLAVVFDCISDPVIGAWSDRLDSRWGRRHPFLLAGTIPMGFGFVGLFLVPDTVVASQSLLTLWLLFWSIWIRSTLSVFAIPHLAMSAEMSSDYRERSAILGTRMFFVFLCTVMIPAIALTVLFNQAGDVDGRFVRENYPVYGMVSCILTWAVGLVTIWSTRKYAVRKAATSPSNSATGLSGFVRDFLQTLQIRNFRQLLAFDVAASASYGVLISTHMLGYIYFWELDSPTGRIRRHDSHPLAGQPRGETHDSAIDLRGPDRGRHLALCPAAYRHHAGERQPGGVLVAIRTDAAVDVLLHPARYCRAIPDRRHRR
jgi:GPH family glycoside/pentoside/hexuronide:cation symporter